MKILYWTEFFFPNIGGVEVLTSHYIPAMREKGHDFVVVTSHGTTDLPDESEYYGIPVYRFHFRTALADRDLVHIRGITQKIAALKKQVKPDLVHLNTCYPSVFFHRQTVSAFPSATLVTVHELPPLDSLQNTLAGEILRLADRVIGVSAAIQKKVTLLQPDISEKTSIIHNALEMPDIEPAHLDFTHPRLLCVGRLTGEKGFDTAVAAFRLLTKQFPRARLIIAGDGPHRAELEDAVSEMQLAEKVAFCGWVHPDRVPCLINSSTIVIMPSRWEEPFGLVALQAAQMGRPVVATRVGGLPEVVQDGVTGLLVEKDTVDSLAEALRYLLENPDVSMTMGQKARIRARERFSMQKLSASYDAVYRLLQREEAGK